MKVGREWQRLCAWGVTNFQTNFSHKIMTLPTAMGVAVSFMCLWVTCCGWTHTSKTKIDERVCFWVYDFLQMGLTSFHHAEPMEKTCLPREVSEWFPWQGLLDFPVDFKRHMWFISKVASRFSLPFPSLSSSLSLDQHSWLAGVCKSHKQSFMPINWGRWMQSKCCLDSIFLRRQNLEISIFVSFFF